MLTVCTSCQVTIAAEVDAQRDGSGVVRVAVGLDRDALASVPDLGTQLRVDDLRRDGWRVSAPRLERDGLTWVRASFAFANPKQAQRAMARLNGPEGPFRDLALARSGSLYRSRLRLTGTIDLSAGLAGFVDADLARRLGAANPGIDPATFERRFGVDLSRVLTVRLTAAMAGVSRSWQPRAGDPPLRLEATSTAWNTSALVLTGAGVLALVAGLWLLVRRRPA
jgi:hypothetical protein